MWTYYTFFVKRKHWRAFLQARVLSIVARVLSIAENRRDREVACSASDRQSSNFESCVRRTVSSHSSHHPQDVLLAQFILYYVHKGVLKPDSFHLFQAREN